MPMITEPRRTGEHVVSEANGQRSREQATLETGNLPAGAVVVLGQPGRYSPAAVEDITEPTDPAAEPPADLAVLYGPVDAREAPAPCVVDVRDCEIAAELIAWPDGASDEQIEYGVALLERAGIISR